jgi:SAM-dependent methyltransferase
MNSQSVERMDIAHSQDHLQIALHRLRYDFVLARLRANQSVLEIGTGLGFFTAELFPRCASYVGVEYDAGACAESRSKNKGAEILQADVRKLPFEESRFSFIVCLEVIEHLGDWQAGVRNINRCLQPDGTAIISIPWRHRGGKSNINPFHLYEPGEKEMVSLLERLFVNVETNYLYFEETFWMRLCRRCHLRRLFGLDKIYADLSAGLPYATARLRIGQHPQGKRDGLIVTVSGKKTPG